MATSSLAEFERSLGRVNSRPPLGFSARAWPFIRVVIAASLSSLAAYVCADLLIDWQPAKWGVADRMALVAKSGFVAILPMVAAVIIVAAQRLNPRHFNGREIAPDSALAINASFVQNTLEQFLLFVVGVGALALCADAADAATVPILAGIFLVGRAFYWWGYHHNTYVRAFGFGVTFYPTIIVYAWTALYMATGIYVSI